MLELKLLTDELASILCIPFWYGMHSRNTTELISCTTPACFSTLFRSTMVPTLVVILKYIYLYTWKYLRLVLGLFWVNSGSSGKSEAGFWWCHFKGHAYSYILYSTAGTYLDGGSTLEYVVNYCSWYWMVKALK